MFCLTGSSMSAYVVGVRKNVPEKKAPQENSPQENCPPENLVINGYF